MTTTSDSDTIMRITLNSRVIRVAPVLAADMQQWAHAGVSGHVCCKAAVTTSGAGCNRRVLGAGYGVR